MKMERFAKIPDQHQRVGSFLDMEVMVDTFTGIEYLFVRDTCNNNVAVTPLFGRDGKPLITPGASGDNNR